MKAKSELMKEKILKAVIDLFMEKGIEKVTTRDLTDRLGVARSHIYHYFKDWQSLSIEAISGFMHDELDEFQSIIAPMPARQKLQEFIDGIVSEAPDPTRKLYSSLWLLSTHNKAYSELMESFLDRWHQVLTDIIVSGMNERVFCSVDAQRVARQLDALLFGYSEHLFTLPSEGLLKEAQEDIDDFIQRTLLARSEKEIN